MEYNSLKFNSFLDLLCALQRDSTPLQHDYDKVCLNKRLYEELTNSFTEKQKELFENYLETESSFNSDICDNYFKHGFSMGIKSIIEALMV